MAAAPPRSSNTAGYSHFLISYFRIQDRTISSSEKQVSEYQLTVDNIYISLSLYIYIYVSLSLSLYIYIYTRALVERCGAPPANYAGWFAQGGCHGAPGRRAPLDTYIYIYIYIYIYKHICIYVYICAYMCICRGGCSGRGVQWIGVVLYSEIVYNII